MEPELIHFDLIPWWDNDTHRGREGSFVIVIVDGDLDPGPRRRHPLLGVAFFKIC